MTPPTLIPLTSITVPIRMRKDYGDVAELAESIKLYGLIQPIVLDKGNNLIAGGRRYAACTLLGLKEVPVYYKEVLHEAEYREMELEENLKRKSMTWQEEALAVLEIHNIRKTRNILSGNFKWTYQHTGTMLGTTYAAVGYCIKIASRLKSEQNPDGTFREDAVIAKCATFTEAYCKLMEERQNGLLADLSKNYANTTISEVQSPSQIQPDGNENGPINLFNVKYSDLSKEQAKERYLANPLNPPEEFESYWSEKQAEAEAPKIIPSVSLSWLHNTDCIAFMAQNPETFDHIITDPPYAIEMSNLDQSNFGMSNIDSVKDEHEVEPNKALLVSFLQGAYHCLKPSGFLVLWADYMQWQFLYDQAINFGFKVQRWPLVWYKLHTCMNGAAQFNFTKNTEIAIVCRKGLVTLVDPSSTSVISAAHDDFKDELGHPFVKPFDVWKFIAKHVSYEGQTILEPFSGRGSGVISMLRMNRRVVACESNTDHYNALIQNVKNHYLKVNPNFTFSK